MAIVNFTELSGDGTFAIANGDTAGRMLVVLAIQARGTVNITGFSYNSVAGTTYGQETTSDGSSRTLATVWTNADLPATAGTYSIERSTSIAGGTKFAVIELSGMDDAAAIEVVSDSVLTQSSPLSLTFTNSAGAFLGMSLKTATDSGSVVTDDASQTTFFADTNDIGTGKIDSSPDNTLTVDSFNGGSDVVYTGIAIAALSSGPSVTAPESVSPGETISFTATGFTPNAATVSDGTSTLTLTSITNTSGDNYTAVVPALPAVGASLQYTTFGAVTLSATNGTDTANDTTSLTAATGQTVTELAATFDTSELSYLFDFSGTPATGDQFIEGSADLALDANGGYVADTDGTYVITGIDATDGIAQSYELIVGPGETPSVVGRITRRNLTSRNLTRRSLTSRP